MKTTDYIVNVEDENLLLEIQNRVFAKGIVSELVAERKRLGPYVYNGQYRMHSETGSWQGVCQGTGACWSL